MRTTLDASAQAETLPCLLVECGSTFAASIKLDRNKICLRLRAGRDWGGQVLNQDSGDLFARHWGRGFRMRDHHADLVKLHTQKCI